MHSSKLISAGLIILLAAAGSVSAQYSYEESVPQGPVRFTPLFGLDYFSRAVTAEGDETQNRIHALFLAAGVELEFPQDFRVVFQAGFALSNYDTLTFRRLPISLELDVGLTGGILAGVSLQKNILRFRNLEVDLMGGFNAVFGLNNTWSIPSLSVEGTAQGRPILLNARAGIVFLYTGWINFRPYMGLGYDKIWGRYRMDETIQGLTGLEEKKLTGRTDLLLGVGTTYDLTRMLSLRLEGNLMPHSDFKNVDLGVRLRLLFVFD